MTIEDQHRALTKQRGIETGSYCESAALDCMREARRLALLEALKACAETDTIGRAESGIKYLLELK